jgi:TPR repeat protein
MWWRSIFAGGFLALALVGGAAAGPLEDGQAAHQRGDYAAALLLWRPLAERGNAAAQVDLGLLYSLGQGVPHDNTEAAKWYRKAAEVGDETAQALLGGLYSDGRGVPQDYVQAHMWLNLATSHASFVAIRDAEAKARDELAAKMTPDQIAQAQRLAREWVPKPAPWFDQLNKAP